MSQKRVDFLNNVVDTLNNKYPNVFFSINDFKITFDKSMLLDAELKQAKNDFTNFIKNKYNEDLHYISDTEFYLMSDKDRLGLRENPATNEGIALFEKTYNALFELEQYLRKDEGVDVNKPMYRMRISLNEMKDLYKRNKNICDYITVYEMAYMNK